MLQGVVAIATSINKHLTNQMYEKKFNWICFPGKGKA